MFERLFSRNKKTAEIQPAIVPETEKKSEDLTVELERQLVLLSALFFQAKYERRKIANDAFQEPQADPTIFEDVTKLLQFYFANQKEANSDIDGDIVRYVCQNIINSQKRELLYFLSDERITSYTTALEKLFENQEFCAQCESWSYYDAPPEEFPISATASILPLIDSSVPYSDRVFLYPISQWHKDWDQPNHERPFDRVTRILKSYDPEQTLLLE